MKAVYLVIMCMSVVGCGGFKEVSKTIEGDQPITFERTEDGKVVKAIIPEEHHIVLTQGVIDGVTVDQDHAQSLQHCTGKYSSEEMAAIRNVSPSKDHSWFKGCTYLTPFILTKDSSKIEKVAGVAMAGAVAFGLHQVGKGLGRSGDTVNNSNEGGSVNQNNGNTSTRSITQTNTNNIRVK